MQPGELAIWKLVGTKLRAIYRKPKSDTREYFSKLTLVYGDVKSNTVKVAGVSDFGDGSPDSRPQVCFLLQAADLLASESPNN